MKQDFRILLLFPPVWAEEIPYLSLPTLTGYLRKKGHNVIQKDLNLEFWKNFDSKSKIQEIYKRAFEELDKQYKIGTLSSEYLKFYQMLKNFTSDQFVEAVKHKKVKQSDYRELCINFGDFSYTKDIDNDLPDYPWESPLMYNDRFFQNVSYSNFSGSSEKISQFCKLSNNELNPYIDYFQEKVIDSLIDLNPDLIGISVIVANQVIPAFTLANLIKREINNAHITIGGPWATQLNGILQEKISTFDMVDSFIIYEGEKTLEDLAETLKNNQSIEKIPNLILREDKIHGSLKIKNKIDLDDLPTPDFDDYRLDDYEFGRMLPLQTSRGCYWAKCTFCSYWKLELSYKVRSIDHVISDIKELKRKYGVKHILFVDADIPPKRLKQLSRAIIDNRLNIKWECFGRFDHTLNRRIINLMARSGCGSIVWGLESASEKILSYLDKGTKLKDIKRILHDSSQAGIHNRACLMYGFPIETLDDIKVSLDFIEDNINDIHSLSYVYFTPERNTRIVEEKDKFSLKLIDNPDNDLAVGYNHYTRFSPDELKWINDKLLILEEKIEKQNGLN